MPEKLPINEQFLLSASIALSCYDLLNKYLPGEIFIKWPNDLYIRDRKAGGILIENIISGIIWKYAIIGIGININQTKFDKRLPNPVSLKQATGQTFDVIDLAKKLLKEGMSQAEKLRSKDTDSDDSNLALKAWWPSTAMLSKLILTASRISSRTALDATQEITDPEIRLFCQVRLANRQLGVRIGQTIVMVDRKQSAWSEYRAED